MLCVVTSAVARAEVDASEQGAAGKTYWVEPRAPEPRAPEPRRPVLGPTAERHTVVLRTEDPDHTWLVYRRRDDPDLFLPVAECSGIRCELALPDGTYRLLTPPGASSVFRVHGDRDLTLVPANPRRARNGMVTGAIGGGLFVVGDVLLLTALVMAFGNLSQSADFDGAMIQGLAIAGGGSMVVGGCTTLWGVTSYQRHRDARIVPTAWRAASGWRHPGGSDGNPRASAAPGLAIGVAF